MSEWQTVAVREVAEVFDGPHATPRKTEEGPWYLSISSLSNGRFDFNQSAHLSESDLPRWTKRVAPQPGDTLFSYETRLGEAAFWAHNLPAALGRRMGLLRPKAGRVEPQYLLYAYLGPQFQEVIREKTLSGSTVNRIPVGDMPEWPLLLPPLREQRAILGVLRAVDDLIANNRRRVEVLEEMARAIYHEWFVKFRYPGHDDVPLVDSALGLIPEGWAVQPLTSVAVVNKSSRKPKADEVVRYLDISALSEREIDELESFAGADAPGRARRELRPGDTVWATVRPNRRAHALVVAPAADWIASTGLAVLTPTAVSSAFLFETASTTAFSDWLVGRATGSAYPAVRANDFEEAAVVVPAVAVDAAFVDRVAPMHELSWNLRAKSSALATIRDLLLPKLVTGQIGVSDLDLDALVRESVA